MKLSSASAIVVDLTPTLVTFSDMDGDPVALAPVIYVDPSTPRLKILAVGEPAPSGAGAVRIPVLSADAPPRGISKLDCLAAFFTNGLKQIADRSLFRLKPEVLVRRAEWLAGAFGGFERDVINHALERAGARIVRWPDESEPAA
jgi:hypothetical protein